MRVSEYPGINFHVYRVCTNLRMPEMLSRNGARGIAASIDLATHRSTGGAPVAYLTGRPLPPLREAEFPVNGTAMMVLRDQPSKLHPQTNDTVWKRFGDRAAIAATVFKQIRQFTSKTRTTRGPPQPQHTVFRLR
jgi:hypothetical protein